MVEFVILGPLAVRVDGAERAVKGARERALLTRLLLDPGRPVSDDRLVEDLWPPEARSARKSLQVRVSNLRGALTGAAELRRTENGYLLDVLPEAVDAVRFERLVTRALGAAPEEAVAAADEALAEWGGAPLAALADTPAAPLAQRFVRLLRDARLRRGRALLDLGRGAEATAALTELVDDDPLDEGAVEGLMRALHRLGRSAEALEAHRRSAALLAEEGMDPGPRLSGLVEEILRHDLPVAPSVPAPRDRDPPPGGGLGTLARRAAPFVGRAAATTEATHAVVEDGARLVTLWGPGGVGKTRLALEVVRRSLHAFSDDPVLVDCAQLDDNDQLADAIARAAGVAEPGATRDDLVRLFAERHVLLLLDNTEHLSGVADVVAALVDGAGKMTVLVTTRQVLGLRSERVLPVRPLPVMAEDESEEMDAVAFLALRAADMGAPVDEVAERAHLEAIARRLDGLPLALELAAARLRLMTPRALATQLAERLDVLRGASTDLPERQRSITAVLEWSMELLGEDAAATLSHMAVFAAPIRYEGIQALVGDGVPLLETLTQLADHAMLSRVPTHDGQPAFGVLETVKQCATTHLRAAGTYDGIRQRHAEHFLQVAMAGGDAMLTSEQTAWTLRLGEQEADLERALRTFHATGQHGHQRRMTAALWRWWWGIGANVTAVRWLELARSLPVTPGDASAADEHAAVAAALAVVQSSIGAVEEAERALRGVTPGECSDPLVRALVWRAEWAVDFSRERFAVARDGALSTFEELTSLAQPVLAAECLIGAGISALLLGDAEQAVALHDDALAAMRPHGPRWELASLHNNLAHMALLRGELAEAQREVEAAMANYGGLPQSKDRWVTLDTATSVHLASGDISAAEATASQALELGQRAGDRFSVARARAHLADIALRRGHAAEAARHLRQAVPTTGSSGDLRQHVWAVAAQILASVGRTDRARRLVAEFDDGEDVLPFEPQRWSTFRAGLRSADQLADEGPDDRSPGCTALDAWLDDALMMPEGRAVSER